MAATIGTGIATGDTAIIMVTVNVTENRTVIMATAATTHRADIALDPVATTVDIDTVIAKDTALVGAITDIDRKPWHYKIESPQDAGFFYLNRNVLRPDFKARTCQNLACKASLESTSVKHVCNKAGVFFNE